MRGSGCDPTTEGLASLAITAVSAPVRGSIGHWFNSVGIFLRIDGMARIETFRLENPNISRKKVVTRM
jgi:hypothetical protein